MGVKLQTRTKLLLVSVAFFIAIIGFMVKLPAYFRHYDKALHTTFYFLAAAFLNVLFAQKKIVSHIIIFICLLVFGIVIEYAQEMSNKILHQLIHGRFDIDDVKANVYGLLAFSAVWLLYVLLAFFSKQPTPKSNHPL